MRQGLELRHSEERSKLEAPLACLIHLECACQITLDVDFKKLPFSSPCVSSESNTNIEENHSWEIHLWLDLLKSLSGFSHGSGNVLSQL